MNLSSPPIDLMQDATDKAFIFTAQGENSKIRLDPKGTSLKFRESGQNSNGRGSSGYVDTRDLKGISSKFRVSGQDSRDRGSGSIYFTPSSTPLREVSGSPTKGTKNLYSAVYEQDDMEGNYNTLPNSRPNSGKDEKIPASRKSKPPFINTHRKSRSFSFPFMPSYWFGTSSNTTTTPNANDKLPNDTRGDNMANCDNATEGRNVHRVLVERDACGSRDYLDVDAMKDSNENQIDLDVHLKKTEVATEKSVGTANNSHEEYDERDALLPRCKETESEKNCLGQNNIQERVSGEDHLNGLKSEQDISITSSSSSTTNSSSNKDTESSGMGITTTETGTSITEAGSSNSELFSNGVRPSHTINADSGGLSSTQADKRQELDYNNIGIMKADFNSMSAIINDASIHKEETQNGAIDRLTSKRISM